MTFTEALRAGALIALLIAGCGASTVPEHWLEQCSRDAECGTLRCLRGRCSVTCRSNEECSKSSDEPGYCYDACTLGDCGVATPYDAVCGVGCGGGRCAESEGLTPVHAATFNGSVPACGAEPVVEHPRVVVHAPNVNFVGAATISSLAADTTSFTDTEVTLSLEGRPEADVRIGMTSDILSQALYPGRRIEINLVSGGVENLLYTLLTLKDEAGRLMLAYHHGSDQLYQQGAFDTPSAAGFTMELDPLCRSSVEEGCFEHQSQARYSGRFSADDSVVLDDSHQEGSLTIGGVPYAVTFWSSSVDGGQSLCQGVPFPGRYVAFYAMPALAAVQ